jgi:hypothetical protein
MESEEFPPEFKLEETDICTEFQLGMLLDDKKSGAVQRKGSLDMHYSILGFINRKIKEKSRQRIMSEEISHLRL